LIVKGLGCKELKAVFLGFPHFFQYICINQLKLIMIYEKLKATAAVDRDVGQVWNDGESVL